ncbi:histidine kinase [Mucilaginibacter sp. BJC16-A38]|uniref:sensor histidine kinase n=1 Tax=Mucilaginibacter phenanthrenivorans TaxID=1234842 RepID=UPI00215745A8|nr:histidine kinase [Mucilaginibacter phenanthrenivorans]MCR8560535.1 histidine kinase [Mucilaginibacter phenanthrenivorans]
MTNSQNWFIKYKLYHIPFWMLYNYIFWSLAIDSPYRAAQEMFFSVYFIKSFFYMIFPAFAVYFNLYFLIPRYLQNGRYGWYFFFLALTIVLSSSLIVPGYYLSAWLDGIHVEKKFGITNDWNDFYHQAKSEPLKSTIAAITLAMSIKLTKNWIEGQRRQQLLEKEKLETELKFLKYQFNPHFLFNSINSIFFLIHKNPDMASDSLAKFSDLLRHQLYESNDNQIPLDKELSYLENFIELEKLRQNKDVEVDFAIDLPQVMSLGIAPFILMTFVENAFKHISRHFDKANWISIKLEIVDFQLNLFVANSTDPIETRQVVTYGGIGLQNVKRRLDLVYPGQYKLDIKNEPGIFEVKLQLTLTEFETQPAMELS